MRFSHFLFGLIFKRISSQKKASLARTVPSHLISPHIFEHKFEIFRNLVKRDFFYKIDPGSHPGLVLHVLCQSYLIELTLIYLVTIELDFTFKLKVDFLFVEFPHRNLEVKAMFDKKQNVDTADVMVPNMVFIMISGISI